MRKWLWKALCEVILHGAYSNLYLKDHLDELPPKDRALASRIFYGTLQNFRYCQAMWQPYAKNKVSGRLGVLLTMSCYQLAFLDKVPAYAIIDEAVALAKKQNPRQGAFVNAVLRQASENKLEMPEDEWKALALQTSLPDWLINMWKKQYGEEEARQLAQSSVETLPVYVRINPLKVDQNELQDLKQQGILEETPEGLGLYVYKGEGLKNDPLYEQGKISAMDPGSYAIACFGQPKPGMHVLDVCAAPGTKTMAMAEQMDNTGKIQAYDLHPHRAKLIEQDAKRLELGCIQAESADATKLEPEEIYDLVLCDVPCSGYGVLARKPDMKLRLNPEDMDSLIPLQQEILRHGAMGVKPEGVLVYSTCTLNKKENEKQVEAFLKDFPAFELEEQKTLMADASHDGFYMARLKRKAQ